MSRIGWNVEDSEMFQEETWNGKLYTDKICALFDFDSLLSATHISRSLICSSKVVKDIGPNLAMC